MLKGRSVGTARARTNGKAGPWVVTGWRLWKTGQSIVSHGARAGEDCRCLPYGRQLRKYDTLTKNSSNTAHLLIFSFFFFFTLHLLRTSYVCVQIVKLLEKYVTIKSIRSQKCWIFHKYTISCLHPCDKKQTIFHVTSLIG